MTRAEWLVLGMGAAALAVSAVVFVRARRAVRLSASNGPLPGTARRRTSTPAASPITDLRSEVEADHDAREVVADAAHVAHELEDIRDACGAEEAVFWRWEESRNALTPACWSTPHAERPRHFQMEPWGPLARWAAEGGLVVLDSGEEPAPPVFAAAPMVDDEALIGVLTVSNARGLGISRRKAKEWLPRHAAQVVRLLALSTSRRNYARQMRQSRALLTAVRQIQTNKTAESLSKSILQTALQVSSGSAAALVRWRADQQKGSVRDATPGYRQPPPYPLDADSLVANACRDDMMLFVEDAAQLDPRVSLFSDGDGGWPAGSLGIVPLTRDDRVIGAIVVASPEPARITRDEVQNLGDLGAVAATSLEIVWEIDEVNRRARTDGLTGLVNRRAFDEQFERLIDASDRFGQPVALILADIDHFKRINDTWGHEAGDEVLRRVAKKLAEGVRTVDVCARYGGEEIAILLPQTALVGAVDLADRLRQAVAARPVKFKGEEIEVTVSLGVASYPDAVTVHEGLFRAADQALYEAKNAGRNCVRPVVVSNGVTAT
jgi:diguanylate cyclase (GGDEF)-like protein